MAVAARPQSGAQPREKPPWLGWVASARRGDRQAFASLHGHFSGLVHAIVISRAPAGDAPDLVQDVFVQLMQRLSTLEDDLAFPAWLMQLARNRASRHTRDERKHEPLPDEVGLAAADRSGAPDVRKVVAALQALPEAYAETLAMRLIEGMTGPEIAEKTGLTPGSVRVNLHRGMQQLRKALGLGGGDGEGPPDE